MQSLPEQLAVEVVRSDDEDVRRPDRSDVTARVGPRRPARQEVRDEAGDGVGFVGRIGVVARVLMVDREESDARPIQDAAPGQVLPLVALLGLELAFVEDLRRVGADGRGGASRSAP